MQINPLGNSELKASVIGLGSWAIGGAGWGGSDRSDDIRAIQAAIDAGINFLDTAPIYGFGLAEEIVGEALADRRDSVILATKCGQRWDTDDGEFVYEDGAGNKIHNLLSPKGIRYELENSLKRLKVNAIDLYQTHWPTATTAIEDTMAELVRQQQAGKIRHIGVSNTSTSDLDRYLSGGAISSVQEMFSMIDRQGEGSLFPHARERGLAVLAYSPMAMGLLTGKLGPERQFAENDNRSWSPRFTVENRQKVAALIDDFKSIATDLALTIPQLVLRWTVSQPTITHVLTGARSIQQAQENAASGAALLSESNAEAVDAVLKKHALKLPHPFLPEE